MIKVSITHDLSKLADMIGGLRKDIRDKAVPRALNRSVQQARTAMSREIRSEFNLTAAEVNQSLRVRLASSSAGPYYMNAELQAFSQKGRSLNLIRFAERFVTLSLRRRRVKAGEGGIQTLRNGGRVQKSLELRFKIKKTGASTIIKGAFIGNKGRTVFIREGDKRLPIKALQTINVPQMFNTQRINLRVRAHIDDVFQKNLAHEIRFFTERMARTGGGR